MAKLIKENQERNMKTVVCDTVAEEINDVKEEKGMSKKQKFGIGALIVGGVALVSGIAYAISNKKDDEEEAKEPTRSFEDEMVDLDKQEAAVDSED